LGTAPSFNVVSAWLKPDKRSELLKILTEETSSFVQEYKSKAQSEYPELEDRLLTCFQKNHCRPGVILTDDLLKSKALSIATSMSLESFKASKAWILNFKRRFSIKRVHLHGEAGSADVTNVEIARTALPKLLQNVSAD